MQNLHFCMCLDCPIVRRIYARCIYGLPYWGHRQTKVWVAAAYHMTLCLHTQQHMDCSYVFPAVSGNARISVWVVANRPEGTHETTLPVSV